MFSQKQSRRSRRNRNRKSRQQIVGGDVVPVARAQANIKRVVPVAVQPQSLFPTWDSKYTQGVLLRYTCSGTTGYKAISFVNLYGSIVMALATGAAPQNTYGIIDNLRVRRIRLIDPSGQPIGISFPGTQFSRQTAKVADGNGSTNPTVLDVKPPAMATIGFWNDQGTGTAFSIQGSSSLIVELHLSISIMGAGNSGLVATTTTSVTQGSMYFMPLDGPGAAPVFPSAAPVSQVAK